MALILAFGAPVPKASLCSRESPRGDIDRSLILICFLSVNMKSNPVCCASCGSPSTVKPGSVWRNLKRNGGIYRCNPCAGIARRLEKVQKPRYQKVPVQCVDCQQTFEIQQIKYRRYELDGKLPSYRCKPCSAKHAYASGAHRGTKGMRFKQVRQRDVTQEVVDMTCTTCEQKSKVSREAVARQLGLRQRVVNEMTPSELKALRYRCSHCATQETGLGLRLTTAEFISKAQALHPTCDYSQTLYTRNEDPVTVGCLTHGPFTILAGNHVGPNRQRCPKCSAVTSRGELELREFVQTLGLEVLTNDRRQISPQELDIWLPQKRVAIEYNGLYWHSEQFKGRYYHRDKLETCKAADIRLIQIFEDEWLHRRELVEAMLRNRLGLMSGLFIGARKCRVVTPTAAIARQFLDQNHVQGSGPMSGILGLEHEGRLVVVMAWQKPPTTGGNKSAEWLLTRFATRLGMVVSGAFSRLHRAFIREFSPESVGSYADLRWGTGSVYRTNGFEERYPVSPDYFYVVKSGCRRQHRWSYRKDRLREILGDAYDPQLTEFQMTDQMGLDRIWDAGKLYFEWRADRAT